MNRALLLLVFSALPLRAQDSIPVVVRGDSVLVRFAEADLRIVVQAIARNMDLPVVVAGIPAVRVTLEAQRPVPRGELPGLLRGLVEAHGLELVRDSTFYRVRPRAAEPQRSTPAAAASTPQLTVVRLRHARAGDVAGTLSALYGVTGADIGQPARPGTLSEELRRNVLPPAGAPASQGRADGPRAAVLEGPITVVPDPVTNSLLIRASPNDAALLAEAIGYLDVRPLQVLIEVVIAEARRDRRMSYGLGARLPATSIGGGNETVEATLQGGGLGDFVVRVLNLGRPDIEVMLRAGASRGDVEILSRPVLVAANNQPASFLVGSQRPFVQVSYSAPSSVQGRDQVVQYKDVGIRLAVRPTISADGYVTLEVTQEVSNATSETAFDAPVIATREATTQVTVRNGQTIVIGGLTDRQRDRSSGGVPFLSSLPLLGGLFGGYADRTAETELFLFLTPRLLATDADVDGATEEYRRKAPKRARP